jgi:hypothetical protein
MGTEENISFKGAMLPTFCERGFEPILERFCTVLEKQDLQPIETLQGKSLKPIIEGVEKPLLKGFFRPFKMEKIEKITLSNFLLMNKILVTGITALPLDDYDLPMLVLEWAESENTISLLVDFIPLADIVMREDYCAKYLDPLGECWSKYKDLPGVEPNPFAWARKVLGPYHLAGNVPKDNIDNKEKCLKLYQDYLEVWIDLWGNAEPIKDASAKEYSKVRKAKIRKNFLENDEGSKSMAQMIGKDLQELIALCFF